MKSKHNYNSNNHYHYKATAATIKKQARTRTHAHANFNKKSAFVCVFSWILLFYTYTLLVSQGAPIFTVVWKPLSNASSPLRFRVLHSLSILMIRKWRWWRGVVRQNVADVSVFPCFPPPESLSKPKLPCGQFFLLPSFFSFLFLCCC